MSNSLSTDGCWNPRTIRSTGDISRHTWGVAIDITATERDQLTTMLTAEGFNSGAQWLSPDPEHFEYITPAPPGPTIDN